MMSKGTFSFLFFLTFANKNDVRMMFRENFQHSVTGAESLEWVHQNSVNQPTIHKQGKQRPDKENSGLIEMIICVVLTIFHINHWNLHQNFGAGD